MANRLYHITAVDVDGNNKDLYVSAPGYIEAYLLWEEYYYPDAEEFRVAGLEPHAYFGDMMGPRTLEDGDTYSETDLRIWELPAPHRHAKVMGWHSDINVVAWKAEL